MANKKHLARLRKGADVWNDWRRSANPDVRPDLSDVDLSDADLSGALLDLACLQGADLSRADLTEADLSGADLTAAILRGAHLSEANLDLACLHGADLRGADLSGADLTMADLSNATLGAADMRGARMGYTIFAGSDLRTTKGLDLVQHDAPSSIGIDTIYQSQGQIPPVFLRGCGVPENFIEYMPSLVAPGAIQFYKCFISYSTKDQEFTDRLYGDLQNEGVRCWYAPHDVQGGKLLEGQIDSAIRVHEKVLLILSPNSIRSDWVQVEVGKAREREAKEGKRVLFPVQLVGHEEVLAALRDWALYHGKEGKESAGEIRRFYIPDFSQWKEHDLYKKEFEKLMRDLRVEVA
ncbi:MAG: toll/interleukin-1 receptor domain-containing protein [Candidatus Sulfotelmatobacter sp.]